MKHNFIIAILVLVPTILFGQLKGEYCHYFGSGSEKIKFLDGSKFEYKYECCTGTKFGKGFYELNDKKLILNFLSDTFCFKSENVKFDTLMTEIKDSILVDIFIGDAKTKEALIYSNLFFKDSNDKILKFLTTDVNGRCSMKFLKSNEILIFYAYCIGYRRFNCTIQLNCSSKLTVYMKQEYGEYSTGDTLIFKIKRKKKKTILLKGDKDYSVYEKYYNKQNFP